MHTLFCDCWQHFAVKLAAQVNGCCNQQFECGLGKRAGVRIESDCIELASDYLMSQSIVRRLTKEPNQSAALHSVWLLRSSRRLTCKPIERAQSVASPSSMIYAIESRAQR